MGFETSCQRVRGTGGEGGGGRRLAERQTRQVTKQIGGSGEGLLASAWVIGSTVSDFQNLH